MESREQLSVTPLTYAPPSYLQADWFEQRTPPPSTAADEWIIQLNQETLKTVPSVTAAAEYLEPYGITVIAGLGAPGTLYVQIDNGNTEQQKNILQNIQGIEFFEQNIACFHSTKC